MFLHHTDRRALNLQKLWAFCSFSRQGRGWAITPAPRTDQDAGRTLMRTEADQALCLINGAVAELRAASSAETRLGYALDAEIVDREQTASEPSIAGKARQRRLGHRGDEENVQFRPAEYDAGYFLDRHIDDAVNATARIVAHQPAVVDKRIPETPFCIDGGAVGCTAARAIHADERAP